MKKVFAAAGTLALLVVVGVPFTSQAAGVEKVSAFVCPVITAEAVGLHNPQAGALGDTGDYTVVPETANSGHLMIPITATNRDGAGTPGGDHAAPGDSDYTAIWARAN